MITKHTTCLWMLTPTCRKRWQKILIILPGKILQMKIRVIVRSDSRWTSVDSQNVILHRCWRSRPSGRGFAVEVGGAEQRGGLWRMTWVDGLVSNGGRRGRDEAVQRLGVGVVRNGAGRGGCSSGLQLTSTQPFLALCRAPSSPPELSVSCQNQSESLMVSASHVRVWTGWHQISGATRQAPYENRCPHYWVATAFKVACSY